MNPQTILKPNILTIALLTTVMVLGLGVIVMIFSPGEMQAVINLGTVALAAFATLMFTLAKPPPNPDVEVTFAADLLNLAAGTSQPRADTVRGTPRAPPILVTLICLAAAMTIIAFAWPGVPDAVANAFGNATIGMIAGVVGKLADDEPEKTVPQSLVLAALDHLRETNAKAGK